jgi:hypothetical protein
MRQPNDFSRRLLADFLAARLEAGRIERERPQRTGREGRLGVVPGLEEGTIPALGGGDLRSEGAGERTKTPPTATGPTPRVHPGRLD